MAGSLLKQIHHKKYFYKTTWERSEDLLKSIPWLKPAQHEFCIVGYREPSCKEAEKFIGRVMYDRLFDCVVSVEEITKAEAIERFQMDNYRNLKTFGSEDFEKKQSALSELIHNAMLISNSTQFGTDSFCCKVTLTYTGSDKKPGKLDLYLDFIPKSFTLDNLNASILVSLDSDETKIVFDKAAQVLRDDCICEYKIVSAEVVRTSSLQNEKNAVKDMRER